MSQIPDNIIYIPIQINGGDTIPNDLLERELFIKNGELYVGDGTNAPKMVIGRIVDNADITNPTIKKYLNVGTGANDNIIISKATFDANKNKQAFKEPGRIYLVDEGDVYN